MRTYTITTTDCYETNEVTAFGAKKAREVAEQMSKREGFTTTVSFFRKHDGQTVYLNRDGFDLTGCAW